MRNSIIYSSYPSSKILCNAITRRFHAKGILDTRRINEDICFIFIILITSMQYDSSRRPISQLVIVYYSTIPSSSRDGAIIESTYNMNEILVYIRYIHNFYININRILWKEKPYSCCIPGLKDTVLSNPQ